MTDDHGRIRRNVRTLRSGNCLTHGKYWILCEQVAPWGVKFSFRLSTTYQQWNFPPPMRLVIDAIKEGMA